MTYPLEHSRYWTLRRLLRRTEHQLEVTNVVDLPTLIRAMERLAAQAGRDALATTDAAKAGRLARVAVRYAQDVLKYREYLAERT